MTCAHCIWFSCHPEYHKELPLVSDSFTVETSCFYSNQYLLSSFCRNIISSAYMLFYFYSINDKLSRIDEWNKQNTTINNGFKGWSNTLIYPTMHAIYINSQPPLIQIHYTDASPLNIINPAVVPIYLSLTHHGMHDGHPELLFSRLYFLWAQCLQTALGSQCRPNPWDCELSTPSYSMTCRL